MANYFSPLGNGYSFVDSNGDPLSGALLFTYVAGSTTKQTTYKNEAGSSSHTNPIELDSNGRVPDPLWITGGVSHKFVLAPSNDTDPPVSAIETWDNIDGVNDTSVSIDQWVTGPAPTFVSTTSLTLVGDQTTTFHVGRRVKTTDSSGLDYGTIVGSAYTTLTTLTLSIDSSGVLDSGLSAISYALLSSDNPSVPRPSTYTLISTDAGATVGPTLILDRASASAADADVLGGIIFRGRDDAGGTDDYGQIQAEAVDTGAASEDGKISIQTKVAGTLATRAYVAQGIVVGSATGGDQGAGTVNATAVYLNGVALSTTSYFEYITSGTAAAVAQVDFTGLTSTYAAYLLVFDNFLIATLGQSLYMRTSTGAVFNSGGSDYQYNNMSRSVGDAANAWATNGGTGAQIVASIEHLNTSDGRDGSGHIWIYNPATTNNRTIIEGVINYFDQGGDLQFASFGGVRQASENNDGLRWLTSSGNITSLRYTIYGLRLS